MTTVSLLFFLASCSSSALEPIDAVEISDIEVTPSTITVAGGHRERFVVTAYGTDGEVLKNAPIQITSSDPRVAVVDGDGTVWAFGTGEVGILAKPGRGAKGNLPPGQEKRTARISVTEPDPDRPGTVTDLAVEAVSGGTITLSFSEVDDGTGNPANYLMRFQIAPLYWGEAADVLFGSCAAPYLGQQVNARRTCTVEGLKGSTRYEFQVVAFRGSLNSGEIVYGDRSNVIGATTPSFSPASTGDAWVERTFESYRSTEELRAAKADFLNGSEDLGLDRIFLDESVAYAGAGLTKSMRYDWVNQGAHAISIGRGVLLPEPVSEVWIELLIRWSGNFTTCHPQNPPCDHKTFFLQVTPDMNYRWDFHFGGGAGETGPTATITMGAPRGKVEGWPDAPQWQMYTIPYPRPSVVANQYFDDEWHVVRAHVRHSTDADTYDAKMQLWVDGSLIWDTDILQSQHGAPRFSTTSGTKVTAILLGRNKDKGLDSGTESMWIGRVRAWREDPGW